MATRRARIQVKPNIAGKSSSLIKRGQNNVEKGNTVQISEELAVGAAAAINVKRGTGSLPTKNTDIVNLKRGTGSLPIKNTDIVNSTPIAKGDSKEKIPFDSGSKEESETRPDSVVQNVTDNIVPVPTQISFTRLKRYGLTSGSTSNQNTFSEKTSSESKTSTTSPDNLSEKRNDISNAITSPSMTIEIPKPVNSMDNTKRTITKRFSSNVPKLNVKSPLVSSNSAKSPLLNPKSPLLSPKSPLLSPKSPLLVSNSLKSPLLNPNVNSTVKSTRPSLNQQVTSPTSHDRSLNMSPLVSNKAVEESSDQPVLHGAGDGGKESSVQPTTKPSVIQRLPFRSRFPKARPNIEALKIRNKNLSLTGNREDSSSRPSSPLKSPRVGKLFSPGKFLQHTRKSTSPVEVDRQKIVQKDNSPESNKEGTPEGRKRHYSNSSINTINSEVHTPLKNNKQKSPKKDFSSSEELNRNSMTMGDLVYWNPLKNPMIPVTPKKKAKLDKEKENVNIQETPPPVESTEPDKTEGSDLPVPQVKIGPDGSIILNEESLIIKKPDDAPTTEVIEENESTATYSSYRKPPNRVGWSEWETEKFYRALSYLGTDFSLMIKLFPNRTRYDIKTKFKREDKLNRDKVEHALKNKKLFDMSYFEKEKELDKKEVERKQKLQDEKVKKSKLLKLQKKKEKMKVKEKDKNKMEQVLKSDRKTCGKIPRYQEGDSSEEEISEDELTEIELTPEASVKTPVRKQMESIPFRRYESSPFVPPFCLLHQDRDRDDLELQVTMSDSEIVSPQKPPRSEVTSVTERATNPDSVNDITGSENSVAAEEVTADNENVTSVNSEMIINENSVDIASAGFPPNANVQIAHDANNLPLVLVYHTPEDGKGETVIHVYQLQNHQVGNVQIPLNSGSTVIDLHPSTDSVADNEQILIHGQSEQQLSYEQENLPFLISSGDENPSQLLVQPISEDLPREQFSGESNENNGFINIIDINASKIVTPNKTINVQIQNNTVTDRTGYHVTINPTNDLESSRTSSELAIDSEFVGIDVDRKYNDNLNMIDVGRGRENSDQ